jgi:hypothetical protein
MTPSDDPFDARPTADLLATDALLDRVGARVPTPDDLDDPLIAALALMAAEIDLDTPPLEETRAALAHADPDLVVGPAAPAGRPHDEATGFVIDLRGTASSRYQDRSQERDQDRDRDQRRRPQQRPQQPERAAPPVAMAPPRSLPRMPAPGAPGGPRAPRGRRERRMRPLLAVAVAVTAIVLGSGVSAAITGGRSVNPLDGVQQVVAELRGGRTQDQQKAYDEVKRHLDAARQAVDSHDPRRAREELDKVGHALLTQLTENDRKWADKQIIDLNKAIAS